MYQNDGHIVYMYIESNRKRVKLQDLSGLLFFFFYPQGCVGERHPISNLEREQSVDFGMT